MPSYSFTDDPLSSLRPWKIQTLLHSKQSHLSYNSVIKSIKTEPGEQRIHIPCNAPVTTFDVCVASWTIYTGPQYEIYSLLLSIREPLTLAQINIKPACADLILRCLNRNIFSNNVMKPVDSQNCLSTPLQSTKEHKFWNIHYKNKTKLLMYIDSCCYFS